MLVRVVRTRARCCPGVVSPGTLVTVLSGVAAAALLLRQVAITTLVPMDIMGRRIRRRATNCRPVDKASCDGDQIALILKRGKERKEVINFRGRLDDVVASQPSRLDQFSPSVILLLLLCCYNCTRALGV